MIATQDPDVEYILALEDKIEKACAAEANLYTESFGASGYELFRDFQKAQAYIIDRCLG